MSKSKKRKDLSHLSSLGKKSRNKKKRGKRKKKNSEINIPRRSSTKGKKKKKKSPSLPPSLPRGSKKKKKRKSSPSLSSSRGAKSSSISQSSDLMKAINSEKEDQSPSHSLLLAVKFCGLAFGCIYLIGLGFFLSANGRFPTSAQDLTKVVTGMSRIFSSPAPPPAFEDNDDSFEDDYIPKERPAEKAREKWEKGERLYLSGKKNKDQTKIRRAKRLLEDAVVLLKRAKNLERDEAIVHNYEMQIQELQRLINDCVKSLNF